FFELPPAGPQIDDLAGLHRLVDAERGECRSDALVDPGAGLAVVADHLDPLAADDLVRAAVPALAQQVGPDGLRLVPADAVHLDASGDPVAAPRALAAAHINAALPDRGAAVDVETGAHVVGVLDDDDLVIDDVFLCGE